MFLFKKFVDLMTSPLAIVFMLALIAAILHWRGWVRFARGLWAASVAILYLLAIYPVSNALLRPLETKYPTLQEERVGSGVQHVIVLGSYYRPRMDIPVTARLSSEGVVRAVEGIRLFKRLGVAHLVLSGGKALALAPSARGYADLALSLGVEESAITLLDQPNDTAEEAAAIRALLGDAPFILVTSAYHMPRAMKLMEREGLHATPAPTGQRTSDGAFSWRDLAPSPTALGHSGDAFHEYLGLLALSVGLK